MEEENSGIISSGSGISQDKVTPGYQNDIHLPGFLVYLSLGFKLTATLIAIPMASWVFATIKSTKSLHKPHNIFVANLMITDTLLSLFSFLTTGSMSIASLFGMENLISCKVLWLPLLPACLTNIL